MPTLPDHFGIYVAISNIDFAEQAVISILALGYGANGLAGYGIVELLDIRYLSGGLRYDKNSGLFGENHDPLHKDCPITGSVAVHGSKTSLFEQPPQDGGGRADGSHLCFHGLLCGPS